MPVVCIDAAEITDPHSFHDVFARVLGFPDYYGRNMDAWIDCLTYADDADAGMVSADVAVKEGDVLTIQVDNVKAFMSRCPDLYRDLIECSAFVNWRRIETGGSSVVALSFYG